ncbi:MAG: glutamate racemase [Chloroflexota bacterium]
MSDRRAIGIFDSGIGGLTVLEEIHRTLSNESTVYLGDVARCPYGPRSSDEVRRFAVQIARFLDRQHPLKLLVIACNTASAAALDAVQEAVPHLPVIGVVEPGARAALAASRTRRIGVMATAGTVRSCAYSKAVQEADPGAFVVEEACPQLVPLVEAGETASAEAEYWVRTYLEPLWAARVDTLILGCTHYPLLRPVIERVSAGRLALVDSAHTTAARVRELLAERGSLAGPAAGTMESAEGAAPFAPAHLLYTTGEPEEFRALAARLFQLAVHDVRHAALAADEMATYNARY